MRVYRPIIELFLNNDTQSSFSSKFCAVQSGTEENDLKKKGKSYTEKMKREKTTKEEGCLSVLKY